MSTQEKIIKPKLGVVIQMMAKGATYERTCRLSEVVARSGAHVLTVEEPAVTENESILTNIIPFNFMAYYLPSS